MDLFEYAKSRTMKVDPHFSSCLEKLEEDSSTLWEKNKLLCRAIRQISATSVIFTVPPGTGKTT